MSDLTPEERGDLAQHLLLEGMGLAVAVREEPREKLADRLRGLSRHELESLAIVLAALINPDQPVREALAWVDFDEYGRHDPFAFRSQATIRQAAPRDAISLGEVVDEIKVRRVLEGEQHRLTASERALGVRIGMQRGLSYEEVAGLLGMKVDAVNRSWHRTRRRAREAGLPVPERPVWARSGQLRSAV